MKLIKLLLSTLGSYFLVWGWQLLSQEDKDRYLATLLAKLDDKYKKNILEQ